MKVKVEKGGPCRKTLVVELPAEDVTAEYGKVLDNFARVARIPGFRQGKASASLVESRYAKEIQEEVKERLISRSYPEAVKQAQLKPLMVIDLKSEAAPKKPLVYRVILDVPPEFKLPKYKHIAVTRKEVAVSDDDVQKTLDRFMEQFAGTEEVKDRPAHKNDLVQIDYTRKDIDVPSSGSGGKRPDQFSSGRNFWLALGEDDAFLPGFADALAGMSVGDRKDIALQLPADFKVAALAGRQVVYGVQIKAVREKKIPVLNDEIFKLMGVPSEAALRDKIRASLLENGERLEKERQKSEIIDYLLGRTDVDLPESIVQEETRSMYATIVRERIKRGSTREQLTAQRDEIFTAATKTAGEKVKLGYILHKIGEDEKITVAEAEIEKEIQNLAQRYRMAPDELKKELEEKKEIDSVRHEIRMGKIIDFLLADAVTEEKGLMTRLFGGGKQKEATSSRAQSASGQVVA